MSTEPLVELRQLTNASNPLRVTRLIAETLKSCDAETRARVDAALRIPIDDGARWGWIIDVHAIRKIVLKLLQDFEPVVVSDEVVTAPASARILMTKYGSAMKALFDVNTHRPEPPPYEEPRPQAPLPKHTKVFDAIGQCLALFDHKSRRELERVFAPRDKVKRTKANYIDIIRDFMAEMMMLYMAPYYARVNGSDTVSRAHSVFMTLLFGEGNYLPPHNEDWSGLYFDAKGKWENRRDDRLSKKK